MAKTIPLFKDEAIMWLGTLAFCVIAFVIAYVWSVIGVWRSANKYKGPGVWSVLARVAILFGFFPIVGWLADRFLFFMRP